jgi:hypothetical protein
MLYTAEWQVWSCPRWMVDEDHACIDLSRDPGGAFLVFAEDRASKAKDRVVGQSDGFRFVFDLEHEDRAEEFFRVGRISFLDVRQNRWFKEEAGTVDCLSARDESRPCLDGAINLIHERISLLSGRKRSYVGVLLHGIASFDSGKSLLRTREKAVVQGFGNDKALCADTSLSAVEQAAPKSPLECLVEVGIVQDDERIAAAASEAMPAPTR